MEKPQALHLKINLFGRATGCKAASAGGPQHLTVNVEQCIWMQLPFWGRIIGKLCQNVNVQCESVLLFLNALHQLSFTWRLDFNVVNIIFHANDMSITVTDTRCHCLVKGQQLSRQTSKQEITLELTVRLHAYPGTIFTGTIDSKWNKEKQAPLVVSLIQPWDYWPVQPVNCHIRQADPNWQRFHPDAKWTEWVLLFFFFHSDSQASTLRSSE